MRWLIYFLVFLCCCQQKEPPQTNNTSGTANEVTPEDAYAEPENKISYQEFIGVYDHESTTKNFSAMLSLTQNGNDLYFNISVAQGGCKGETEGVVMLVEQDENSLTGFYESENCRLQFTFIRTDLKIEIKEVMLCQILQATCSYEGTYLMRKN